MFRFTNCSSKCRSRKITSGVTAQIVFFVGNAPSAGTEMNFCQSNRRKRENSLAAQLSVQQIRHLIKISNRIRNVSSHRSPPRRSEYNITHFWKKFFHTGIVVCRRHHGELVNYINRYCLKLFVKRNKRKDLSSNTFKRNLRRKGERTHFRNNGRENTITSPRAYVLMHIHWIRTKRKLYFFVTVERFSSKSE